MNEWHELSCEQTQVKNPTCRCMQIDHHIGSYRLACSMGLVVTLGDNE